MDFKSQYTTRYRKDLSIENVLAKVARRKSLTQKENRHRQYRKSRGLALSNINISPVKESDISALDAYETLLSKKNEKAQKLAKNREDLLRRFKEEKQLRKLKEQREQAKRGIFRCGVYKPDDAPLPSFVPTQCAPPVIPEKCQPLEARITRLTAKSNLENTAKTSKVQRSVANPTSANKVSADRRTQYAKVPSAASRKRMEKENLGFLSVLPVAANTRTTKLGVSAAPRRLPNVISAAVKPAIKSNTGVIPQRKVVPKEKNKPTEIKAVHLEKPKDELQRGATLVQTAFNFIETTLEKEKAPPKIRQRSFAPLNFQFQPMNGIPTFKFNSMTPQSTNAFLSPSYSWSPAKVNHPMDTTCIKETGMAATVCPRSPVPVKILTTADSGPLSSSENELSSEVQHLVGTDTMVSQPALLEGTSEATMEKKCSESPEVRMEEPPEVRMEEPPEVRMEEPPEVRMEEPPEVRMEEPPEVMMEEPPEVRMEEPPEVRMEELPEVKIDQKEGVNISETTEQEKQCLKSEEIKHDVPYFREILRAEIERLTLRCVHWDQINEDADILEDAKALIRTTVGQTRLLIAERFKQFEGLVDDCEFKRGERETTCTDLDGFWDMVHFQIEDVLKKFEDLGKLQQNNWQQVNVQTKKFKRRIVPDASLKPNATCKAPNQGDNARAAARNRLAAIKAALKTKTPLEDALPAATDTQTVKAVDTVVFDAGFFKVESPAKSAPRSSCKAHQRLLPQSIAKDSGKSADQLTDPLPSPNDLLINVKKVLFGSTKNVQSIVGEDAACPVSEDVDHTKISRVTVSNADEHILAKQSCSPEPCQSPELTGFQVTTKSPKVDNMKCIDCLVIDGGVMCSPERKIQPSQQELTFLENHKDTATRNPPLDFCCDPLDFLKSGTPPNLTKLRASELPVSEETASDLIVFSPVI